ncbi:MAG: NAD(P)-dependent oxidoreductase [Hyphomonadaceae bacterium]|nr:NAD(P)-dependent oxidoreductase [Clostridia bacterium]
MAKSLIAEGKRCLQCANPKCSKGCPVHTDIKEMINLFLQNDILKAGEMLFQNNPLSLICSIVCPHEKQCEGNCVLGIKGQAIQISEIENYISDYYLNFVKPTHHKNTGKRVGIIGAGPAGITIAFILAARGYDITIFDAHDKIGGVLMYGIPEFRLPKTILDRIKNKMVEMGIKIRPNTLIGPVLTIDDLFRDGYKAVFIGTGVWKPKALSIKGESLGHVHYAIDYLKNPSVYDLGESVCVIGAGNVAMDVARTAIRKGVKDVTILYRGDMNSIAADKSELEYAKIDGVKFEFLKKPFEITDDGVLYQQTIVEKDEWGHDLFTPIQNTEQLFACETVIVSVSQGPRNNIVSTTTGIDINKGGLVSTDLEGRTTREGVFASGDVVTGAKTVVEAVRVSKAVADAIDVYVTGQA